MDASAAEYLRAIALGLLQALTEFLPISSSGHLILAPHLLGGEGSSLIFDVGLHFGTLLAVLTYFWREWLDIAKSLLRDLPRHGTHTTRWSAPSTLGLRIVLGTLPAVVVGTGLASGAEERLRSPILVGVSLLFFSGVIWASDRWGAHHLRQEDLTARRTIMIGLAQAVALIPGTSRSGITIAAARGLGFERDAAARFSFMLSAPAVAGAAVLTIGGAVADGTGVAWGPLLLGTMVSAGAGILVIRGLLRYVRTHSLNVFIWYRVFIGSTVLAAAGLGLI